MNRLSLLFIIFGSFLSAQIELKGYYFNFTDTSFDFDRLFIHEIINLYNSNQNDEPVTLTLIETNSFVELFEKVSKPNNFIFSLGGITITTKRKSIYDFSTIYLPVKNTIVAGKSSEVTKNNWDKSNFKVGYFKNTVQYDLAQKIEKSATIQAVEFKDLDNSILHSAFRENLVDMFFVEGINLSNDKHFKQIEIYVSKSVGYGIMYPKGSTLKQKLEPIINYFIHSKSYHTLLKKVYGLDVSEQIFKKLN